MRRALAAFTVILAAVAMLSANAPDDEPKKERNILMQKKLVSSQKLLEGLAIGNFPMLEKNAEDLVLTSKKAEWQVLKTPDYIHFSEEFRRQADQVTRSAKEKNLDGAALAYVQLTMTCVNCHKHVREVRIARGETPSDKPQTVLAGK
jgi:hypothetical protein